MGVLRKILGVFVMIAGILGLLISVAGLVGLYMYRPVLASSINTTVAALTDTLNTGVHAMEVTDEALGSSVKSIDALSDMLETTAASVSDTQPVIADVNGVLGEKLPESFVAANKSLRAAEEAAASLEVAITSFDTFRAVMATTPISAFLPAADKPYSPDESLADSLGDLATGLEDMPETFQRMSTNLDRADNNLEFIKANLDTMSSSVSLISGSLGQYRTMIGESKASMENLQSLLVSFQNGIDRTLNLAAAAMALFFLWLLAAQVVIFSQGWELFQGTAGRMEGGEGEAVVVTTPDAAGNN